MKRSGPLKRKTPMKRVSDKRLKEGKEYSKKRSQFLTELPLCEVCMTAKSTDIHHIEGRGRNYLNEETWLSTCRLCHDKIHREPIWARKKGYLK